MKSLKDFKKFAVSQKIASNVSGGAVAPIDGDDDNHGGGGGNAGGGTRTLYCCKNCNTALCGYNAWTVKMACLNSTNPGALVVCN